MNTPGHIPSRAEATSFARSVLAQLNPRARAIRLHLSALVERAVVATASSENTDVLKAAAHLQEVGVVHSSVSKQGWSLSLCHRYFEEGGEALDGRILDCIRSHDFGGRPRTAEGRLMQVCHGYATTHCIDYLLYKHALGAERFERLQLRRIAEYASSVREHPRGAAIDAILQDLFLAPDEADRLLPA